MALTNIDGSGGVNILTRSGDFKSTYDILLEISKVWDKMNDVDQAALLELVAGKTRGSVVAALFQNGDVLENAYKSATDASGSAMKELNNHLDSIQGRIDLFNNSLQTMWMNLINTDVVKFIVDTGTELIKLVDTLGAIPTLIGAFGAFKLIKSILGGDTFKVLASSITEVVKAKGLLTAANQKEVASFIATSTATALANSSLVQYAITSGIVTKEQVVNMTTTGLLGTAFLGLAAKVKTATIAMAKFLFTTPVGWAILSVAAITSVITAYNTFGPTHENYIEKLEEETEALKSVQSELQTVQDELDATKKRMDELDAKGPLSFVEEEEYNRLQKVTEELKRQEEILLAQEKRARQKQIETALKAANTDPNKSDSVDVKSSILNGMYYAASQQHDLYVSGSPYAAGLQEPKISNEDKYESVINSLKEAKAELEVAEKELSTTDFESKEYDAAEKKVQKAKERVDKFNDAIESMNDTWNAEYGEIGYVENATTEAEKQWNEYYRQHQDFVDQWMLLNDGYANGKATVLDRIFGETGTDIAKEFKKEFESAINSSKDPAEVIEGLFANEDYSNAFSGLEKQFGITIDNIKSYFTQTGEFAIDPEFDITKYAHDIKSHSAVISEFQEALKSLEKGTFTMDDFLDLIERFPDLAKGVDISSNAFYGLSRNLNKAIKTRTKSFVNDLKELKKSLEAAGKSTDSIDQLITAIENMPDDALDNTIERYSTLADEIERAKVAQDRLSASMGENPNEGYETRGEAMDYMKEAMKNGEIGSESNLWNVAKEYGFTYDSAKTINENADALAKFIAVRETWWKTSDDGDDRTKDGYSYEGAENFIQSVEKVVKESEAAGTRLSEILKWDYDETTGVFDFDFDNENLDEIISLLSKTQELAGLTSEEWIDMMTQIGQYYNVDWSNYDDILDELDSIANGASDAKTKVEEYGKVMQEYFGKGDVDLTNRPEIAFNKENFSSWASYYQKIIDESKTDTAKYTQEYVEWAKKQLASINAGDSTATVYSSTYYKSDFGEVKEGESDTAVVLTPILPDGTVLSPEQLKTYAEKILKGEEIDVEGITLGVFDDKTELKGYEEALHKAQEEYHTLMDSYNISATIDESGLKGLREIKDLQEAIQESSDGTVVINEDAFRTALTEAGYTENKIDSLIDKIKTLDSEAFNIDPLKIDEAMLNNGIAGLKEIESLQSAIKEDSKTGLTVVDTDAFRKILDDAGYAKGHIDELIKKIQEYNGVVSTSGSTDPLGINAVNADINTLKASLSTLGVGFDESIGAWFDGSKEIKINVPDLVTTLKEKGWNEESIRNYCTQLSNTNIEGFKVIVDQTQLDTTLAKSNEIPETENTTYTVDGAGLQTLKDIKTAADNIPTEISTTHTTYEKTVVQREEQSSGGGLLGKLFGRDSVDGTAHVQGTAYNSGSWGVSETETSLVGELGPELLVRGNRWTTVGENGAEFTQVKKGDIIFNHKQTESLLKNGYVTSRGRAYASGTAYASGGGTFNRYEFSGQGGYTKYDVNDKVVDKFGNAASDLSGAADDLSDAADDFEEVFDWVEVRLEEINEQLDLLNAQLENAVGYVAKNKIIDTTLGVNNIKLSNLKAGVQEYADYAAQLLAKVPSQYRDAVQNGAIDITEFTGEANEETVEAINNYREWAQKVADLKQQIEELEGEIAELAKQKFDNVSEEFDNIVGLIENATDKLDAQVSLMEDRGYVAAKQYYESMIVNTKEQSAELEKEKVALQQVLDEQVKLGNIKVGSDAWYEMVNQLYEVDAAIVECESDLESYQNAINDIYWDNFDELINRLDYLKDETQSLIDLMDSDDLVVTPESEDGWSASDVKWTDEGLASLGLYAQQMEIAEYQAKQYEKAIDDLNKDYIAGKYSESEYLEKLNELTSAQYDSIESYYDAQDAIKDLNETRVDSIKEGIEKEIEAYEELIEKKKEELDAEKDLYDFQKGVAEQQKEISDIERKIAALSADNSASARAKRAQLEAELAEAKAALEETYYERSIEDQQNALDKELESFQEEKDAEITKWEEYLENVEQVVADSLTIVQANASDIYDTLSAKASEYNLTLSESIMSPWQDGALAISDYQTVFDTAMSSTMDQLEALKAEWQEIIDQMAKAANGEITSQKKENSSYTAAAPKPNNTSTSNKSTTTQPTVKVGGKINAGNAQIYSYAGDTSGEKQYYSNDPIYKVLKIDGAWVQVRHHKLSTGVTGWFKKNQVKAYAKGTKGIDKDQLALIDELGDELVMHAGKNGRLEFMTKGSTVIPHDITENLMQLGELNPQDILDRNRPVINAPHITNNNIELNVSFGEVVHIDHVDNNAVPNLAKTVEKQIDKYMKGLNSEIRKYVR